MTWKIPYQYRYPALRPLLISGFIAFSSQGYALWSASPINLNQLKENTQTIEIHSLQSDLENRVKHPGFGLLQRQSISFQDGIKNILRNKIKSPFIQLKMKHRENKNLRLTGPSKNTIEYSFEIRDTPICDYQVRAHDFSNGKKLVLGSLPDVSAYEPPPSSDWPKLETSFDSLIRKLEALDIDVSDPVLLKSKKCYAVKNGSLLPAWKLWVNTGDTGYRAIGDSYEVMKLEKLAFDLIGKVTVYESNPVSAVLKTYELELDGDYHLNNDYFTTKTNTVERARSANHDFTYDPIDYRFQEASAFVHVALMFEYFRGLGYDWAGPKPMDIRLHVIVNSSKNNALYQPAEATTSGKPTISIGDGDEIVLQNLPLDSDVVSHEFSHHVIYGTLTSVIGESLVLHEGLADFFSNARTKDPCLGESICPANSLACWKKAQCLRTSENSLEYATSTYTKLESHLKGQIISGFLWDLHSKSDVPAEIVTELAYEAVTLLVSNSGVRDFLLATLLADDSKFDGKHCTNIYDVAVTRGFEELLTDISCDTDSASWGLPSGRDSLGSTTTSSQKNSKDNFFSCGSLGNSDTNSNLLLLLLLFALPIAISNKRNKSNFIH